MMIVFIRHDDSTGQKKKNAGNNNTPKKKKIGTTGSGSCVMMSMVGMMIWLLVVVLVRQLPIVVVDGTAFVVGLSPRPASNNKQGSVFVCSTTTTTSSSSTVSFLQARRRHSRQRNQERRVCTLQRQQYIVSQKQLQKPFVLKMKEMTQPNDDDDPSYSPSLLSSSTSSSSSSSSSSLSSIPPTTTTATTKRILPTKKILYWIRDNILFLRPIRHWISYNLFWPKSGPDSNFLPIAQLPPSSMGCPFRGKNTRLGSSTFGPGFFYKQQYDTLFRKNIRKKKQIQQYENVNENFENVDPTQLQQLQLLPDMFTTFDSKSKKPLVTVIGKSKIQQLLKMEFNQLVSNAIPFTRKIIGPNSLRMIQNSKEHTIIRQLVRIGVSTPQALHDSIPSLEQAALTVLQPILLGEEVVAVASPRNTNSSSSSSSKDTTGIKTTPTPTYTMLDICRQFTLTVARCQILGLELPNESEISKFHIAVQDWLDGLFRPDGGIESRTYLVSLLEQRIDELEQLEQAEKQKQQHIGEEETKESISSSSTSSSTLSRMVFATTTTNDDNDNNNENDIEGNTVVRRLTRDEVIDNSLLLILGGTDTSAGTLTAALLMLGLQPEIWTKLVEEQQALLLRQEQKKENHGTNNASLRSRCFLTKQLLDDECPYLEAVIKEALRLAPIASGSPRATKETILLGPSTKERTTAVSNAVSKNKTVQNASSDHGDRNNKTNEKVVDPNKKTMREKIFQIPAGWMVQYDRWLTHRNDPATWLENDKHMDMYHGFRPERWMVQSNENHTGSMGDEETTTTTEIRLQEKPQLSLPSEFIPFGAGPRYCIGAELAIIEMKVFLSVLARHVERFELVRWKPPPPGTDDKVDIEFLIQSLLPCPVDGVEICNIQLLPEQHDHHRHHHHQQNK